MGANGSHASGVLNTEEGRAYFTLYSFGDSIKVLGQKNPKQHGKLPEESKTPNRIYVSFLANGDDIKEIAKYGPDGKKQWAIHTLDHHGISPHYHIWKDGKPLSGDNHLTKSMHQLLQKLRIYGK